MENVKDYTGKKPGQLLNATDIGWIIGGISPKQVMAMVETGEFIPPMLFGEEKRWMKADVYRYLKMRASALYHMRVDLKAKKVLIDNPEWTDFPEELVEIHAGLQDYQYVRRFPCVYFLINFGTVVYVGQSKNLPSRIAQHRQGSKHTPKKDFNRVVYLPVREEELNAAETRYIKKLQPKWNISQNGEELVS
jgi:predicted GIY-YIG superfamily endonuclease